MQYLAALGRDRNLSLGELETILGADGIESNLDTAVLSKPIDLSKLGGITKIGRVIGRQPISRPFDLPGEIAGHLPDQTGKLNLGLSYYGFRLNPRQVAAAGLDLKRKLDRSLRLVLPRSGMALSAAQTKFNGLTQAGLEVMVARTATEYIWAIAEQVQDIDWYSRRDYGRPARRPKVGMLPPKLAQILINLTAPTKPVYDPFCGVGTILSEALLLGRASGGSDISPDRITDSRSNLSWLTREVGSLPPWQVAVADSRSVKLPAHAEIVSEGYLGPNNPSSSGDWLADLSSLYEQSLVNFSSQQTSGQSVVICLPSWPDRPSLPLVDQIKKLGYNMVKFAHPDQPPWLYRRPGQQVGRQILVLRKH